MSGSAGLVGAPVRVQVHTPAERELERKAREVLLERTISGVYLVGDQLEILLDDGGTFTMSCSGGFKETS